MNAILRAQSRIVALMALRDDAPRAHYAHYDAAVFDARVDLVDAVDAADAVEGFYFPTVHAQAIGAHS